MGKRKPLFQEKSAHLRIRIDEDIDTNTAHVRLASRHSDEGLRTWSAESAAERNALFDELVRRFGADHVSVSRPDGDESTDRLISVRAASVEDMNHLPQVMAVVEGFVQERKNLRGASADGMEALMRALRKQPKPNQGRE